MNSLESIVYKVLLTYLLVFAATLLGAVLPKRLAVKYPENLLCLYFLIRPLCFILSPLSLVIESVLNLILKAFKINLKEIQESEIEDDIISMVNEGHEQGVFDAGQAEMISNIFELDDKEVSDIMTHKKRIVAVDVNMPLKDALQFMLSENYSRYPLYEDNLDNIIGILHLKDVAAAYISRQEQENPAGDCKRAVLCP